MSFEQRLPQLDGLRGVASLMVLLNHLALCVIPSVSTQRPDFLASHALIEIGRSPLSVIWGGDFGVCIFFILSGFVLAKFTQGTGLSFPGTLARRYVRLALPMLASTSIAYFLLKIDVYRNLDAATAVSHSDWQALWYRFTPNLTAALYEGLLGSFVAGRSDYNSNLWTMQIELAGSVAIFLLYSLPINALWRLAILLVSIVLLPGYYPLFAVGATLLELYQRASRLQIKLKPGYRETMAVVTFAAAILAGGFPASGTHAGITSSWHRWLSHSDNALVWHMFGASFLMVTALSSQMLSRILASRPVQILGRLSFPIYLIQIPLLCSLTSWLMLGLASRSNVLMVSVTVLVTVIATFAAAALLYRYVERPSLGFSREVGIVFDNSLDWGRRASAGWKWAGSSPNRRFGQSVTSNGFENLIFRYKRSMFQFIVKRWGGTGAVDRALRHLTRRRPALFEWTLRLLCLEEFFDPDKPWHNPPCYSSDELVARWPRETAFLSLRIGALDPLLGERPVRDWDDLTTTVAEGLASAYFELGRFHRAREALQCAAALGFKSSRFAYLLGCLYLLEGEEAKAVKWIAEATELSPGLSVPSEYFSITMKDPPYQKNQFDFGGGDVAVLRSAYDYLGQRLLHVGEGQLRPAYHATAMTKKTMLLERARPSVLLKDFLNREKIDFDTMQVLPWQWTAQIGHLGMMEVMLRMRSLGWWKGRAIVLAHGPSVANRVLLSLFENFADLTIVEDGYADGAFKDPLRQELVASLRSHGLPYYAWKNPDGCVVPWHEAGARAMWDWEKQDRGYPLRDVYDATYGNAAATLEQAQRAFKSWGMSPSDWYVCVHIRESSFNAAEVGSGQNNRNASTANFEQVLKYITGRGGWVVKLGASGSPPLPVMPRVVDYARSEFKSELMDIHLIRHARFFVGTTSGLANVAVSFGLPTAQVNCLTTEAQLWHSGVRFCLKPIYRSDGRMLSQREITSSQWRWGLFTADTMRRYGLHSVDNAPDEILETVKEVEALANGDLATTADDRALIDNWRACLPIVYQYGRSLPSLYVLRKFQAEFLD
jgi:putative glycosyltransferase (TIGR04372 family)